MPPTIALLAWFLLLLALLRFDPAKEPDTSFALWIPVIWMFIAGSRLPSQWLGVTSGIAAQALEEGNPLDRIILFFFILLALGVLVRRPFEWNALFAQNLILLAFLLYALVSIVWSDFPLIASKRWFRDLGNYFVVLIVVTDRNPLAATRTVLRRTAYLLIPLSVLLIKYFPEMAKSYGYFSGVAEFVGASTSKNMLGVTCLVSGLYFFWDTKLRWQARRDKRNKRIILINLIFIWMTLWILHLASSATSTVCLGIACLVVLLAESRFFRGNPTLLKFIVPSLFGVYLTLSYGFDLSGSLASSVGRDPTLTGRSNIWNAVLSTHTNPLWGAGYQSFWLGPRLDQVWKLAGGVNEAHNGYLETYLNLGLGGCFLLVAYLIVIYFQICKTYPSSSKLTSLGFALWTVILFYNMTESAALSGHYLWVICLTIFTVTTFQYSGATQSVDFAPVQEVTPSPKSKQLKPRSVATRRFPVDVKRPSWR